MTLVKIFKISNSTPLKQNETNLKPINSTAIDEGRELSQPVAEGVSYGAEGHDDVKVVFAVVHKESKQGQGTELVMLIASLSHRTDPLQSRNRRSDIRMGVCITVFKFLFSYHWMFKNKYLSRIYLVKIIRKTHQDYM